MSSPKVKLSPEGWAAVRLDRIADDGGRRPWIAVGANPAHMVDLRALSDEDVQGWPDYLQPDTTPPRVGGDAA